MEANLKNYRYMTPEERKRAAIKWMQLKRELRELKNKPKRKSVNAISGGLPSLGKRR